LSLPEDIRQEYLQTLGIDSYFPRFTLPSAPESKPCDWPDSWLKEKQKSIDKSVAEAGPANVEAAELASVKPITDRAGENIPTTTHSAQPERTPVEHKPSLHIKVASPKNNKESVAETEVQTDPATAVKPRQEEFRLQLLCIRVSEELAIINAMPHFGPKQLTSQHMKLLQNFIQASGFNLETLQVDEKPFHWPMVQGEFVDNSKSAAASALTAYLQQKVVDWQFRNLLVMGEQVVSRVFTLDEEQQSGEEGKVKNSLSLDEQSWQTFYTRSLDEILQSPGLKKEVWSVLRKLQA
jgi:hypothetical protein